MVSETLHSILQLIVAIDERPNLLKTLEALDEQDLWADPENAVQNLRTYYRNAFINEQEGEEWSAEYQRAQKMLIADNDTTIADHTFMAFRRLIRGKLMQDQQCLVNPVLPADFWH